MDFITIVFLVYSFLAFYFLFLFILTYVQNKREFFSVPPITKEYSLSIVVPCFNGEEVIGNTINNLLKLDYRQLKKIIVVDDCSTDNSYAIAKEFQKKYPDRVLVVQTPKNSGNSAGAKNYGVKFVNTELIGFTDDDSLPEKDSVNYMIGFFDDKKVGAVTSTVLVQNRNSFILRLQSIEYKVIKFSRKLLEFLDSIYVTPGPLAIYRKSAFDDVKGFDEKNLTEDIEITWHLQYKGYKIKMAVPSRVYSIAPDKIKDWIKQRNRWNIGGLQTISKYKSAFLKKGTLGKFILPFFVLSWVVGLFGIGLFGYRIARTIALKYLSASYSIQAQTAVFSLSDVNFTLSALIFFGLTVFFLSLFYTIFALSNIKEKQYKKENWFTVGFYMFFYLLLYPIILIISIYKFSKYKFLKRELKW
ncbi:MAG: glycosyltransferase [Nanoarchaeota archaeon]|nr:glycosyltransferase [Nanoarchaeota archaeon]